MRCACLAAAGHLEEARALLAALRREQPQLTMAWLKASVPYQTPELRARYLDAMANARLVTKQTKERTLDIPGLCCSDA